MKTSLNSEMHFMYEEMLSFETNRTHAQKFLDKRYDSLIARTNIFQNLFALGINSCLYHLNTRGWISESSGK